MPEVTVGFTSEHKRSESAENAVKVYAARDTRNIASGTVRSTPQHVGGETWHTGGTNPNSVEHITVEFRDAKGNFITTKDIDREGKAV